MKAAIIVFSPSGNTARAASLLATGLERAGIAGAILDITRDERYFLAKDKGAFLRARLPEHDLLFVGAPVYAHHLQYHAKDLIAALPAPGAGMGHIAIPFVTYGGINSGVALEEAERLLRKGGRTVPSGLKIASSHRVSRVFMDREIDSGLPEGEMVETIDALIRGLGKAAAARARNRPKALRYKSLKARFIANAVFDEKRCHERMYPKILVDSEKCSGCGHCARVCPVCHLAQDERGAIAHREGTHCVHCLNCVAECPSKAAYALGDLDRMKAFMERMIAKGMETPSTAIYPERGTGASR